MHRKNEAMDPDFPALNRDAQKNEEHIDCDSTNLLNSIRAEKLRFCACFLERSRCIFHVLSSFILAHPERENRV